MLYWIDPVGFTHSPLREFCIEVFKVASILPKGLGGASVAKVKTFHDFQVRLLICERPLSETTRLTCND